MRLLAASSILALSLSIFGICLIGLTHQLVADTILAAFHNSYAPLLSLFNKIDCFVFKMLSVIKPYLTMQQIATIIIL